MDARNRITVRLAAETTVGWPHGIITEPQKRAAHATSLLVAALDTVQLDFQGVEMLKQGHNVDILCANLDTLRLRLRLAVPQQPEDADLASMVQASHEAVEFRLNQLSAAIQELQIRMPCASSTFIVGRRCSRAVARRPLRRPPTALAGPFR